MSKQKTILHIAPTPFFSDRGCHIRIEGIANSLDKLGFKNLVCTYHHGRDIDSVKTKRIKTIKQYTKTEAGPSIYKLWADWRLLWLCVKQYRKQKPVAIHAHLHEGVMIGGILKLLFFWDRTPLIGDLQGSLSGELDAHGTFKRPPILLWPFIAIEWILLRCTTKLICSSTLALKKIESEFGLKQGTISLVQDGANTPQTLNDEDKQILFSEYKLPTDSTIVVYSGALLEAKGLNELKQIIKLTADIDDLHFLIIGYPTENLETFLVTEELQAKCTLTGQVPFEQLPKLLQLADIAIDPKNSDAGEGSGKMLNYIAASLPVLAFDHENNKDFLPEKTELAADTNEMVSQLSDLIQNIKQREKIKARNFAHFNEFYSWTVTQSQLKKVYGNILD